MSTKDKRGKQTNIFDVMIALMNGFLSLFKIEKVICILVIYLIARDFVIIKKVNDVNDVKNLLIDTRIIEKIIDSNDILTIVLGCSVVFLIVIILMIIFFYRSIYVKEIDRLVEERSELMHGLNNGDMEKVNVHHSSKKRKE